MAQFWGTPAETCLHKIVAAKIHGEHYEPSIRLAISTYNFVNQFVLQP